MSVLKKKPSPNYSIYAEIRGQESLPGLLFLHGFLGSSQDWTEITDALCLDFFCVALDLPGHGNSLEDDEAIYRMPNLAAYIVDLLQTWSTKKWKIVGYSMGGRLALYLAIHYPDIFDKAVMVSASPGLEKEDERLKREYEEKLLVQDLLQNTFEQFLKKWYQQPLFSSLSQKENFLKMWERRLKNSPQYLSKSIQYMGLSKQASLWQLLGGCLVSLQFVCGDLDEKFVELNKQMCRLSSHANLTVITDCGHSVMLEVPDKLMKILKLFL
jgi:2-succinyl-6-hydroxy-2,4-cyclohexadiene-1-carboxylate synthase